MDSLEKRIESLLQVIDTSDYENISEDIIEKLEQIIIDCNARMNDLDVEPIPDSIYDVLYGILKSVKPESVVFSELWDEEGDITDYTELLVKNPMMSIETCKSYDCNEIINFIDRVPENSSYFASYKINGHGIRVVYKDGYLVSATSRARSSAGRDLTHHMQVVLGEYKEELESYGLVELRGEVALKLDRLEEARQFNPSIKSAFSAVSSLIKPSAKDEETELLSFLCYRFIVDDFEFDTREEEFQKISDCGFDTPEYTMIEGTDKEDLLDVMETVVDSFAECYEEFGYFCDGVVFELNDKEEFNSYGQEGNHNLGNIALKVGIWKQDLYTGIINKIIYTKGKSKYSPVAIVSDNYGDLEEDYDGKLLNLNDIGVLTAQGNRVKRVPLYEPRNLMILDAYEGEPLCFKYGGEAGVVPCFPDGRLLKEDTTKLVAEEDEWVW